MHRGAWRGTLVWAALALVAPLAGCARVRPPVTGMSAPCPEPGAARWDEDALIEGAIPVGLVVPGEAGARWRTEGRAIVARALAAWGEAGLPMRLRLAAEGEAARIQVHVVRRLPADARGAWSAYRAGVTQLVQDAAGGIHGAEVFVAEQAPSGRWYGPADQDATLLHELGHALGLPHAGSAFAIMAAVNTATALTPMDVRLARRTYAPGACGGAAPQVAAPDAP